ncbi:zinc-binding dehydrogenase [uncultured Oscillibacter sp.]|uniref:zinc-dependent alcohol dehydrogenase n=1 Tax=uncultured Oscillibacter sp. TaxID=876091 RepID=UPI00263974E1|nr:alcohol dehydrogenase catalytic domain-containing protein [uncultured Oscillibacter sp.]
MRGLVKFARGPEGVALQELPEPVPVEGELKVKVLAASVCGSDIHAVNDERTTVMPVVLGHEYVGQVVETRGDVLGFRTGDWVMTLPACYNCGICSLCRRGLVTLCPDRRSIGFHVNGAMANYLTVPARYSFRLPTEAQTLEDLLPYALTEPLACVVRGVYEKIRVNPGDTVVVSGPGVMGQFATQVFKTRGAYVILSGLPQDREKLALARSLGADETVDSPQALEAAVRARNPLGADITCDATGVPASLETCMKVIRPLGVHLQLGMFGGTVPFRLDSIFDREVTYVPSNSTAVTTWPITLDLLARKQVTLSPFLSLRLPLEEWRAAFDAVIHRRVYKALLLPDNHFSFKEEFNL